MDRLLLRTTALTPVLAATIFIATPVMAQTSVGGARTTPLVTSSAGDVTVASGGSVTLDSGTAITVDSNNSATVASGGTLTMGAANGASGIVVNAGTTSTLSNAGVITVLESFTPADANSDGITDGSIAQASGRYGIHLLGASAGSITNSGTITIDGLNSAGIALDGAYTGGLTNSGTITVQGDYAKGIVTQGVTGNVAVNGTVTVVGKGAQAVVLNGDIGGTFSIQGTVGQARTFVTDSSTTLSLSRSDLQTGLAAVQVSGNVAGGIDLVAPAYSDTSGAATGSITSYGSSPALLIGGANAITIGTVAGRDGTFSVALDGNVTATAYYSRIDAAAVVIGGQGGTVSLPGGIGVTGNVVANTNDSGATAILINQGSTVPVLYNSGAISATISSPGVGATYGVRDLSGTLTQINNTGFISATGSSTDTVRAIDLSANTTGVTISQYLNSIDAAAQKTEQAASGYNPATATIYTYIKGDIYTGSGADTLDIQSGGIYGNSYLGAGDDVVKLSGDSHYVGDVHFGAGRATLSMAGTSTFVGGLDVADQVATLTIGDTASFRATGITGGSQLAVTVNGGSFGASQVATLNVNALTVGSTGTLAVYVSGGAASRIVANTATLASGAKVSATLASLSNVEGTYTILTAGSLTGTASFDGASANLPVLFRGDLSQNANNILLTISRKSAAELGLNRVQGQAYGAIFASAVADTNLGKSLLQVADTATLKSQFNQLLPDHAGGVFDVVTRGSRLVARHIMDNDSFYSISDVGGWLEPVYFHGSKDADGASAFTSSGFGLSGGLERVTGIGRVGVSIAYIGGNADTGSDQTVKVNDYELGVFWRTGDGPLYAFSRLGGSMLSMKSTRTFNGTADGTAFTDTSAGSWKGWAVSGMAGASYRVPLGQHFSLKPMAVIDYFHMHEGAYQESGSTAMELTVDGRNSSALAATTTLTLGWSAGQQTQDYRPFRVEVEGGPRTQLSGSLGSTTAAFTAIGQRFTLTPDALKSGWMSEARIVMGGFDYTWKIAAGADKLQGTVDYSARASLSLAF